VISQTIRARVGEGRIAAALARIQNEFASVAIGSYPYYREDGAGVQLVVRGRDSVQVEAAATAIDQALESEQVEHFRTNS
jgi:molybdopterin-biosynthesis enzyme MoeA-like protein